MFNETDFFKFDYKLNNRNGIINNLKLNIK